MEVKEWPIDKVKPYENNPRNNDEAVEATANSIEEFGWQQPIVVDKDGVIIAGHTRLKAAKKLKLKQVPVTVAENLTDEQVKAYRLADNKTGELAGWDFDLLNSELEDLTSIDMSDFGFDTDDIDIDNLFEDSENEEKPKADTLSWPSRSIEISNEEVAILERLYSNWQDGEQVKTFVEWLGGPRI